jgi:hypothetical protein
LKVLGKDAIVSAVQRIIEGLESWGYREKTNEDGLTACICYFLLTNRNPSLEAISFEQLVEASQTVTIYSVKYNVLKISRILFAIPWNWCVLSRSCGALQRYGQMRSFACG